MYVSAFGLLDSKILVLLIHIYIYYIYRVKESPWKGGKATEKRNKTVKNKAVTNKTENKNGGTYQKWI